jgi:hypothetical protein
MVMCSQEKCEKVAVGKLYWPGAGVKFVCHEHGQKASAIAKAMGFYLTVEELVPSAPVMNLMSVFDR